MLNKVVSIAHTHKSFSLNIDRDSKVFTAGVVCVNELYHIECMAVAQSRAVWPPAKEVPLLAATKTTQSEAKAQPLAVHAALAVPVPPIET